LRAPLLSATLRVEMPSAQPTRSDGREPLESPWDGAAPLVTTKLASPLAPSGHRERLRVSRSLDLALDDRVRLALVVGPPGYGKTVAVAGWLESRQIPRAWLSLDAGDDDSARFVRYLASALSTPRPAAPGACARLFGPSATPAPELVAATVLDAIGASDEPFVLVLDDYHVVRAQAIHTLVGFLIEHAPPFCHIVLLSREDPPFGLARLRAHGRLAELRAEDLRYTADEAASFFADARPTLTADELQRLVGRTEGWVAAMQLASLGLARADDPARVIGAFEGMQRHVLDYLADEVVGRIDEELRSFLVRTSIADRFSAELCERLTGRTDAAALLGQAERSHLFVVALDEQRQWYRYHGLFADYLRSRLTEPERGELHVRAADWYQRAGLPRDAIPHLLAAGAFDDAARLIEGEARVAFEAGEHTTLLRWIDALPRELAAEHADLVAWGAWALFDTGQLAAADAAAARHLAATSDRGPAEGRLLALRSLLRTVTGPDAESLARAGLDLLGDDVFFRSTCLQAIGLARLARGELPAAVEGLTASFELIRHAGPAVAFAGVTPLGQALLAAGRRHDAEVLCRELLEEYGTTDGRVPAMGWYLDVVLGMLRYEANDVAEARRLLDRGFEAAGRFRVGRTTVEWAVPYLAFARRAAGDADSAFDALRVAAADIRRSGIALPVPIRQTEARLRLLEGDIEAAARWAGTATAEAPPGSPLQGLLALSNAVTIARVRLAQRRPEEARDLLHDAEVAYRETGAVAELISVLVLQAVAAEGRGRRDEALRKLKEAIGLAAPGGYVRRVVEDGARLAHLLPLARRSAPAFVDEVIAGLGTASATGHRGGSLWATGGDLLEILTRRELEVLRLLAGGARNAEIARSLGVSVGTARWHVGNVLAKLGERSRAKAVLRAQQLGLV
jgi:LuxR family transcriptional regulator, maltose regulon positive regulatory protein